MSSTIAFGEENIFKDLFNISSLRGFEGAGVIVSQREVLKASPVIRTLKTTQIAGALAYSEKLAELLKPRCNIIAGHARWPTKGGTELAAAHPHRFGHIIGVHNGTMHKVAGEDVKDRSDSALLFESFEKIGVEETIKTSDGAYALVWVDEKEQTINFLRNGQRTLYFKNVGWSKNINTLVWASESEMMDFVFKRNYRGNNTWDTYLPVDTWFKYPLDVKHLIQPVEVKTDVKPAPKVYAMGEYRGHYGGGRRYRSGVFNGDDQGIDDIPWMRADQNVLPLPRPGMTLKQQERLAKRVAKEEAARQRRLEQFRAVNAKQLGLDPPFDIEDQLRDLAHEPGLAIAKLEGKECAWCGSVACVGDTVFPTASRNRDEFLCVDCSRNPDCQMWISETKSLTVGI
jgi:hypothetical protein